MNTIPNNSARIDNRLIGSEPYSGLSELSDMHQIDRTPPWISVVVCTHNRCEDALICVSALSKQLHNQNAEIILVDSGSHKTDAERLKRISESLPVQVIREEASGLSLARNVGLRAAHGDWVVFIDDDATPFNDWLSNLHAAIEAAPERLAAIGGYVEPLWPPGSDASHVGKRWRFYLSCIEEETAGSIKAGHRVCGANIAFRKKHLQAIGGFNPALGRIGEKLISGEESFALRKLMDMGMDIQYDPSIRVAHRIAKARLELGWIKARAYWEGVTEVALAKACCEPFGWHLSINKLAASTLIFHLLFLITKNTDSLVRSLVAFGALRARLSRF